MRLECFAGNPFFWFQGFGSCQDDYKYNDSCIAIELKMKASITYLMVSG